MLERIALEFVKLADIKAGMGVKYTPVAGEQGQLGRLRTAIVVQRDVSLEGPVGGVENETLGRRDLAFDRTVGSRKKAVLNSKRLHAILLAYAALAKNCAYIPGCESASW